MAKFSKSFQAKGELSVGEMKIYEVKKDEVNTVNFLEMLQQFDGKTVSITIKEEVEIIGVDEDEEDEDEE